MCTSTSCLAGILENMMSIFHVLALFMFEGVMESINLKLLPEG
jgi:hypothetical protein